MILWMNLVARFFKIMILGWIYDKFLTFISLSLVFLQNNDNDNHPAHSANLPGEALFFQIGKLAS